VTKTCHKLKGARAASGVARKLNQAFQIDCCDLGREELVLLFDSLKAKFPT
jgi:hypothetical protein